MSLYKEGKKVVLVHSGLVQTLFGHLMPDSFR